MKKDIQETKKKIIESLEGVKEYQIFYKFADVIETIKAKSKGEAEEIADNKLYEKPTPMMKTYCYEIEVEEVEE